ncbi:MAG: hypothetical protein FWE20_10110 [Defluviitaleaceae bacterium]|nr:hypothetical protein [Defluviitaleaceae bacterium]
MSEGKYYRASGWDTLNHGDKLKIERSISLQSDKIDIAGLISQSLSALEQQRNDSVGREDAVLAQLVQIAEKWGEHATQTKLLDKAIEYLNIPAVNHSANQWVADEHGFHKRSNAVYTMSYRISEDRLRQMPPNWFCAFFLPG